MTIATWFLLYFYILGGLDIYFSVARPLRDHWVVLIAVLWPIVAPVGIFLQFQQEQAEEKEINERKRWYDENL